MITLPRRSVTRFFIPLIDVLTVLFCIFLLMPLIRAPETALDLRAVDDPAGIILDRQAREPQPIEANASDLLRHEREELERLQQEKIETLQQRLFVRVLEIDADNGKLFTHEADRRLEIASQAAAERLIARQKQEAGGKELYYLFLLPRRLTGYPLERQAKQYEHWFKGVAHGRDNPLGGI
jgi:biopolymer transport protein ExbD